MIPVKTIICLVFCSSLFACSSTERVTNQQFSDNGYAQGYVSGNFSHTQFTSVNSNTIKKPLNSDHQLMLSLLNRPMTEDQAMMLTFAEERSHYAPAYARVGVAIKGAKATEKTNARTVHLYAHLIEQDINAVTITAPQ